MPKLGWVPKPTPLKKRPSGLMTVFVVPVMALLSTALYGQSDPAPRVPPLPDPTSGLASLKTIPVPEPSNLSDFVRDKKAAILLGKALFWDMQVGSDGVQACASCHFHAGADRRLTNQLNPGLLANDVKFKIGSSDGTYPVNYTLTNADYPFHKLADPTNAGSQVISDANDITGSQGVWAANFIDIVLGQAEERWALDPNTPFQFAAPSGTLNARQVENRNTPTVINAIFNFRNFWDGRARNTFNGVNPFGEIDPNATVLKVANCGMYNETVQPTTVRIGSASLASQAVGPPLSSFEMSFAGRSFAKLGKKMLNLTPLSKQMALSSDSVLGAYANANAPGLAKSYTALIQSAFQPQWWQNTSRIVTFDGLGNKVITANPNRPLTTDEFTVTEANFSLFFGLAIQLYEATLVSDDSPFDRSMDATGTASALTPLERDGLTIFTGKGRCINCHKGAEFTGASDRNVRNERLERMLMGNNQAAVYDNGFYNIGVRSTLEDLGVGGFFPSPPIAPNTPLSDSRLGQNALKNNPGLIIPVKPAPNVSDQDPFLKLSERVAVDGAFKTPSLRNSELTGPYFHNGGQATLGQVVEFYNRGGDFANANIANLDPDIQVIGLNEYEKEALTAFLRSLTDDRVRYEQAPFDHPQLFVPNGHTMQSINGRAGDVFLTIDAVGSGGTHEPLKPVFPRRQGKIQADFNGDGRTDFAVTRASNGNLIWYTMPLPNSAFSTTQFGLSTDTPTPGDYDGDGKTDFAVFRPSNGTWYILGSRDGYRAVQFGTNGDAPVPGDYDGDGKTDLAVFRPSNGTWYILLSSTGNWTATQFGTNGDVVAPGDYDGDGKTDLAVFRPSNGTWYILGSRDGYRAVQFGTNGDAPVPGDYDGDGKTDLAVFRPSNSTWYILNSREGFKAVQFGAGTDKLVPGDYDGDGKTDLAVFRPSSTDPSQGAWWIRRSTSNLALVEQFGFSTDRPVPLVLGF